MASGGTDPEERRQQVLAVQELYHGRFTEGEILALLRRFSFHTDETVEFIMKHKPQEVRDSISKDVHAKKNFLPRCEEAKGLDVQKKQISCCLRQFACQDCDNMWWKNVPKRKPVSECRKCHQRFDAVPIEYEWGVAKFDCDCGNTFTGFCQKNNTSPCYKCDAKVSPTTINPPNRSRVPRRTKNQHCCDAQNCPHSQTSSPSNRDRQRPSSAGKDDIDEAPPKTCVKAKVKNVLYPSNIHASSGSTVASFLPDTTYRRSVFRLSSSMPDIGEDSEDARSDKS